MSDIQTRRIGDSALVVDLGRGDAPTGVDLEVNARALVLAGAIRAMDLPGVRDVVPTFRTVGIYFDPIRVDGAALLSRIQEEAERGVARSPAIDGDGDNSDDRPNAGALHHIPVCYGGSFGPDLEDVAAATGLAPDAVARTHASMAYRVLMLGFAPGFAYMGPLHDSLVVPRRDTPRTVVPRGAVAIAGNHTGIYPASMPGGWQIIGRTWVTPFEPGREEPFLFRAGDRVQFYPVPHEAFEQGS